MSKDGEQKKTEPTPEQAAFVQEFYEHYGSKEKFEASWDHLCAAARGEAVVNALARRIIDDAVSESEKGGNVAFSMAMMISPRIFIALIEDCLRIGFCIRSLPSVCRFMETVAKEPAAAQEEGAATAEEEVSP